MTSPLNTFLNNLYEQTSKVNAALDKFALIQVAVSPYPQRQHHVKLITAWGDDYFVSVDYQLGDVVADKPFETGFLKLDTGKRGKDLLDVVRDSPGWLPSGQVRAVSMESGLEVPEASLAVILVLTELYGALVSHYEVCRRNH